MRILNVIVTRIVAYPALAIGIGLTYLGGWLISFGAWACDISIDSNEQE